VTVGVPPGEEPAVLAPVLHPVCLPPGLAHPLGPALHALDLAHRDDRLAPDLRPSSSLAPHNAEPLANWTQRPGSTKATGRPRAS
jgi:hypothetical protein